MVLEGEPPKFSIQFVFVLFVYFAALAIIVMEEKEKKIPGKDRIKGILGYSHPIISVSGN